MMAERTEGEGDWPNWAQAHKSWATEVLAGGGGQRLRYQLQQQGCGAGGEGISSRSCQKFKTTARRF